jgi:hypothetical protein
MTTTRSIKLTFSLRRSKISYTTLWLLLHRTVLLILAK